MRLFLRAKLRDCIQINSGLGEETVRLVLTWNLSYLKSNRSLFYHFTLNVYEGILKNQLFDPIIWSFHGNWSEQILISGMLHSFIDPDRSLTRRILKLFQRKAKY